MSKAYVKDWKERPSGLSSGHTFYDVTFDITPEHVKTLGAKELAENIRREFEHMNVEVPSGKCKGFGVEEISPNQFVIFCEYPSS